tara:strand:+ start:1926 stop:4367 length:2442 start_codon:yes stop_codon:yes gene_type:complete
MTEIPLNANYQLTQALNQLSQAAPSSAVARQAIEVIVKQLEGNLISLNPTNTAQLKAALIPTTNLTGTLNSGQPYQVKLNAQQTPVLQFFSSAVNSNVSTLPLAEPLTQLILRLPPQQLNQLMSAVLPQLSAANTPGKANILQTLPATVVEQGNKQLALSFGSLKITLPINVAANQPMPLASGDKVTAELSATGKIWQLNIVKIDKPDGIAAKQSDQLILSNRAQSAVAVPPANSSAQSNANNLAANTANINSNLTKLANSLTPEPKATDKLTANTAPLVTFKINISPEVATPIIKGILSEQAAKQSIELPIALKTLITQLSQSNTTASQDLLNKIINLVPDKIVLQVKPSGEAALLIQHPKLMANLALTATEIVGLKPLKISGLETIKVAPPATTAATTTNVEQGKSSQVANTNQPISKDVSVQEIKASVVNQTAPQDINKPQITVDKNQLAAPSTDTLKVTEQAKVVPSPLLDIKTLQQLVETNPAVKSLITPQLLNSKAEQSQLLQALLRVSQPKAELASTVLTNIDKILTDPANFKGFAEPSTQNWLKQLSQEIKQSIPQGNEQDANQIKQLMTAPPLSTSSIQMITPPASQGLLSGLVTMLQVSLASRLMRNQPSQAERIAQILPSFFSDATKTTTTPNPARAMQEFGQLEQRHQLMREIGRILSEHQSTKLNNAEKMLQGQETFYYNLPSVFGGVFKNVELLIKREEHKDKQAEQDADETQNWQLTMKMAVGELGELLTKAKLGSAQLEVDFYASNDTVLKQLMNFLPLLKRRLVSLGIEVTKSQCQLGKIPETLDQRPYHIFKAKA